MGYENYYKSFDVSDTMIDQLVAVGKGNNVKPDLKDLNKNRFEFKVHVKAQIARKIWLNNGFYPIFNQTNEILQQAIKMFDHVPELSRHKM
jgi:carboxyl-terminal processing protease